MKAPQKAPVWARIDAIHAALAEALGDDDLFVDWNEVVWPGGAPVGGYHVEDGLHLTAAAYEASTAYSQPRLTAWLVAAAGDGS